MKAKTLNAKGMFALLKETYTEWSKDNCMRLGAALAYYSIFSIAPLIMIAISIVGAIYGQEAAAGEVSKQLSSVVGPQVAQSVEQLVQDAGENSRGGIITGGIVLLLGASGVFAQLKEALNTIWEVKPKPNLGIWGFVRTRLLAFGVVLAIGFLMLVSLILTTAIAALRGYIDQVLGIPAFISQLFAFVVPFAVEVLLFATMFKMLPDAKIQWKNVWVGAVVTAFLFEVGKSLLSWYLSQSSTTSSFGAAGSLVLVLLWVYYTSLIVFFGAEFTEVYSRAKGQVIEPKEHAMRVTPHERAEQGMEPDVVPHPSAAAEMAGRDPNTGASKSGDEHAGTVRVEPSLLTSRQHTPEVPRKERLAPLIASGRFDFPYEEEVEEVEEVEPVRRSGIRSWTESFQQHPLNEVGAALGFGLVLGLISRAREHHKDELSPGEHLRIGSKAAALAGIAALARLGSRLTKRVNPNRVRRTAEKTAERIRDLGEELPRRVETALR